MSFRANERLKKDRRGSHALLQNDVTWDSFIFIHQICKTTIKRHRKQTKTIISTRTILK